jgi:hypothetical protein
MPTIFGGVINPPRQSPFMASPDLNYLFAETAGIPHSVSHVYFFTMRIGCGQVHKLSEALHLFLWRNTHHPTMSHDLVRLLGIEVKWVII